MHRYSYYYIRQSKQPYPTVPSYFTEIFRLFFPERCAACGNVLPDGSYLLCPHCRWDMPLTGYCGVPLDYPPLKEELRLALVMGTEGDGLPEAAIEGADYVVRIPMAHGVDSLNVAAASAVACWELRCGENH